MTDNAAFAASSDIGRKRQSNQDYAYAGAVPGREEWLLLAVADGVGGHAHGEWASRRAIEALAAGVAADPGAGDPAQALASAVTAANTAVFTEAVRLYGAPGAATTLVAALVRDGTAWWANVGDSRLYLLNAGEAVQVSEDHSWVAGEVRAGRLTAEAAARHPRRNEVTRTIGFERSVAVDRGGPLVLAPGAALLLCSDGLHGQVPAEVMAKSAFEGTPQQAVEVLIDMANEAGGPDNITVALFRMPGVAEPLAETRRDSARPARRSRWRWLPFGVGSMLAAALAAATVAG